MLKGAAAFPLPIKIVSVFRAQEAEEKVARPPSAELALGKEQCDEHGQRATPPQPATG